MNTVLNLGSAILLALLPAMTMGAKAQDISGHLYEEWPLIVFADTPLDDLYVQQLNELRTAREEFLEQRIILYFDDDPVANSSLRAQFEPEGFLFVLIGKDGEIKLQQSSPVSNAQLFAVVDGGGGGLPLP